MEQKSAHLAQTSRFCDVALFLWACNGSISISSSSSSFSLPNFMMPAMDVTQPTPRVRSAFSLTIYLASDLKAPLQLRVKSLRLLLSAHTGSLCTQI